MFFFPPPFTLFTPIAPSPIRFSPPPFRSKGFWFLSTHIRYALFHLYYFLTRSQLAPFLPFQASLFFPNSTFFLEVPAFSFLVLTRFPPMPCTFCVHAQNRPLPFQLMAPVSLIKWSLNALFFFLGPFFFRQA